ncbi:rod shape-determining protein MreD [Pelistega indica]|uniref:rod shape-determining protein MreD n=1 Tax=Pelistega indica TaxID=1414851 RepID=UPI000402E7E2|nr:rod shape-determining protein MreD [Pelistega indica]
MASKQSKHIGNLRPIDSGDDTFYPPTALAWVSIFIVFLSSLLPWRDWPGSPDILLLVLAFWCFYNVKGVGLVTAFLFGIVMDVHDTNILGRHALYYILVLYAIILMRKHMSQFSVFAHFTAVLPVFVLAAIPSRLFESWLAGCLGWLGLVMVWRDYCLALVYC